MVCEGHVERADGDTIDVFNQSAVISVRRLERLRLRKRLVLRIK